jgi:GNAT superfamily N-acetyltransferase
MHDRDWIVEAIGSSSFEKLASGLAGSQLHSVLLEVMRRRAGARSPAEVLAQYHRDAFCSPAPVDLRTMLGIDSDFLAAASEFEALDLSPVAPLGVCSAVAITNQHRVLSALRMTEVVSDPTNVLALECASRLRNEQTEPVHLATSQRVLRAQPVPKQPGYSQHFRIFVLASSGRETQDHRFTVETVQRHVRAMLDALERLERTEYAFGKRRVEIFATAEREELADRIAESFVDLAVRKPLEHAYYSAGLRFQIWVTAPDGSELPLIDGGAFDWLAKLSSNRRAVFIATGAGSQLIALRFRTDEGRARATADAARLGSDSIRRAQTSDAIEMARLSGELGYSISVDATGAALERLLVDPRHFIAVAGGSDRLLGWMHVEHRTSMQSSDRAELIGLVVDASARRRGTGRALVDAAERWAQSRGLTTLTVRSNVTRELSHPFYEALGFVREKTQHLYRKRFR